MDTLVLSRRNLQTLLNKLDDPNSARTLVKSTEDGERIYVRAEEDNVVYADRMPGPVHPKHDPDRDCCCFTTL